MSRPDRSAVYLGPGVIPRGPHVYAREVDPFRGAEPAPGELVEVFGEGDRFEGHALFNPHSDIRLRWLSRGRRKDLDRPAEFLQRVIASADRMRRKGLRLERWTDAYRIVHAEGDDLPGLIIDRFGDVLVCEYHSLGFWHLRGELEKALRGIYRDKLVVHKVARLAYRREGFEETEGLIEASDGRRGDELADLTAEFSERGIHHRVQPGQGHKTGWFCDQRENRVKVAELATGREVVDLCCNAGGFALQAARHDARQVTAVDLDEVVLEKARWAVERNALDVELVHADAFHFMRDRIGQSRPGPEVVVLDPHKIVASRNALDDGLETYSDLNTLALRMVRPAGFLATFSCSGPVDLSTFLGMLFRSARRADRNVRLLEVLGAPADHPQRPDFPRSRYLKGALLAVD